jgi:hypothetical protein
MADGISLRRKDMEGHREVFLLRLVSDLGRDKRDVAGTWEPPMTAAGRQVAVAREFENRLRAMWRVYGSLDVLGSRQPLFRESLRRFHESDDVFGFLPADGCEEVLRLRQLFVEIVEAGLE